MARLDTPQALKALRDALQRERGEDKRRLVSLCAGSGCGAYGTAKVYGALKEELAKQGMGEDVLVKLTGCHGFCEKGPIMVVHPEGIFYPQVKVEAVPEIVEKTIRRGEVIDSLTFKDPATKKRIVYEEEIPFYKLQQRIIFGNNGTHYPTTPKVEFII